MVNDVFCPWPRTTVADTASSKSSHAVNPIALRGRTWSSKEPARRPERISISSCGLAPRRTLANCRTLTLNDGPHEATAETCPEKR